MVVSTETSSQPVSGTVTDGSGKTASTSVTVKLDKTAPAITIASPADGSLVPVAAQTISGTLVEALSGTASVTCNGLPAAVTAANFTCPVTLTTGSNSIAIVATDVAGNPGNGTLTLILSTAPKIILTAPANLSYLNLSPTTVSGTVNDPTAVVTINSVAATVANGQFSVQVPLAEGPNILTASATAASGTGTASIQVTLDTTPPHVTVTSPPDDFVTAETSITVAGSINDIVVGTVNSQQASVTVNGVAAQVSNRTFLAANIPLSVGTNSIQVVGKDRVGLQATATITVTRQAVTNPLIRLISGNNQSGIIGSVLGGAPLVVSVTDPQGAPLSGKPVIFKVTQNNGMVSAGGAPAASLVATTNAQGRAQVQWTLGMRAGAGGNAVEAYSVGYDGTALFTATGSQGPVGKIVIDTGNEQVGEILKPLPKPLIAVVVDSGNNRLAGVPVIFTVKQGGGNFAGQPTIQVTSDSDGRVSANLTLGFQEGNANHLVEANFPANQGYPAGFRASGRAGGNPTNTTISGVVLDNSNVPIPGVKIQAVLTNVVNSTPSSVPTVPAVLTNAQGQFTIPQAPVGFVKLLVDGSTAQRPGSYPSLDYDIVTVAGQQNTVGQPIFLLPLNTVNQKCVTATTGGGTITMPEAPGFSLTFAPGQVTFPGGSKQGCVSVTAVHGDKVPMVPGFGQQPRFIVTIQPAGAVFNPPAAIALPNVDGLKAREITEMYSFDHDIGSFVAIGTGIVSDDGQVIRSSPGVGVLKAGWHCGGDPQARGTAADCQDCYWCDGATTESARCVPDPAKVGTACTSPDQCHLGLCGATAGGTPVPGACNIVAPKCTDDGDICTDTVCQNGNCSNPRKSAAEISMLNSQPAQASVCVSRACRAGFVPSASQCGPGGWRGKVIPECLNSWLGPAIQQLIQFYGATCPASVRNAAVPICFTPACSAHTAVMALATEATTRKRLDVTKSYWTMES